MSGLPSEDLCVICIAFITVEYQRKCIWLPIYINGWHVSKSVSLQFNFICTSLSSSVDLSKHSPSNAEHEAGQAARTVFQVFSVTRAWIESSPPALLTSSQSTVPLSVSRLIPKQKLNGLKVKNWKVEIKLNCAKVEKKLNSVTICLCAPLLWFNYYSFCVLFIGRFHNNNR